MPPRKRKLDALNKQFEEEAGLAQTQHTGTSGAAQRIVEFDESGSITSTTVPIRPPPTTNSAIEKGNKASGSGEVKERLGLSREAVEDDGRDGKEQQEEKERTQSGKYLDGLRELLPHFINKVFAQHCNPKSNSMCECDRGLPCTVQCSDCLHYPTQCELCFIDNHRYTPYHWALIWNEKTEHFQKADVSKLQNNTHFIQFGHHGHKCPNPASKPILFTLVAQNGVHGTRVRYCDCRGSSPRHDQLIEVGLFPATADQPITAFTFTVLKEFHLHSLTSKKSSYDYVLALRRLSDNVFTDKVPDPYGQFRTVFRIWSALRVQMRMGQSHNIDAQFPNRPKGNLVVYCPSCPEYKVNMEDGWEDTEAIYRHAHACRWMADGNHHVNKYSKNTDPDDISLWGGRGYFEDDKEYQSFLAQAEDEKAEKSVCNYLNAVNKQDRKKFKNMDISGVINVQCDQVFILTSTDMPLGERYMLTDRGTMRAVQQRLWPKGPIPDLWLSYDCACQFCRHFLDRIGDEYPELYKYVEHIRWCIPYLHMQNHKDVCMYCFFSGYMVGGCHFHGETAEHTWSEMNQVGAQTRQMNGGHRHDTLCDHFGDWNWRKLIGIASTLKREADEAFGLFESHAELLETLTLLHADRIEEWLRYPKDGTRYQHAPSNLPTATKIFDELVVLESRPALTEEVQEKMIASPASHVSFIQAGIDIQKLQRHLKHLNSIASQHPTEKLAVDIRGRRAKLVLLIESWRETQAIITPLTTAAMQKAAQSSPEDEILFLPSNFTAQQRKDSHLEELAELERKLRKGEAYDLIRDTQTTVKALSALCVRKSKHAKGQAQNTRANTQIDEAIKKRRLLIDHYNAVRDALIELGYIPRDPKAPSEFPLMSVQSTYRKPTEIKRMLGDSRRFDGGFGNARRSYESKSVAGHDQSKVNIAAEAEFLEAVYEAEFEGEEEGHTLMNTRKRGKKQRKENEKDDTKSKKKSNNTPQTSKTQDGNSSKIKETGWIWVASESRKMSDAELKAWEKEGDRVQWFRQEAETYRWLEQFEVKHAEFERVIRYFAYQSQAWTNIASSIELPTFESNIIRRLTENQQAQLKLLAQQGRRAYARRQSARWKELELDAKKRYAETPVPEMRDSVRGGPIAKRMHQFRTKEIGWLEERRPNEIPKSM